MEEKVSETTDEMTKIINFEPMSRAFEYWHKNQANRGLTKTLEEAFDKQFDKTINRTELIVNNVQAWSCYTPPSRREKLLNRIIDEGNIKMIFDSIKTNNQWKEEEKKKIIVAWDNASRSALNAYNQSTSAINKISFLSEPWKQLMINRASLLITGTTDDMARIYFQELEFPGNLSDDACRRFFYTVFNKQEAELMIAKLSFVYARHTMIASTRDWNFDLDARAKKLWQEVLLRKFSETKSLEEAEKIFTDFTPNSNHSDILINPKACHHITRFINNYKSGIKIYNLIIAIHSKDSLISRLAMDIWAPFIFSKLENTLEYFSIPELEELYKIVTGQTKKLIVQVYISLMKAEWETNPIQPIK